MILLDAYALLALARNERAADEVEKIVRAGDAGISAVNLFEATDVLVRRYGWTPDETAARFNFVIGDPLPVVALDERTAWRGALLRGRHYDRVRSNISLADCVLLATAGKNDAIATADPAVAGVAALEQIDLLPLPDSSGRRP